MDRRQIKNRAKVLIDRYGNHAAMVARDIQIELEGRSMRFYFYESVLIEIKKNFNVKLYNHTKRYGKTTQSIKTAVEAKKKGSKRKEG